MLTVDCGNSTIDCLDHCDGSRVRFPASHAGVEQFASWLRERRFDEVVLASVVEHVAAAVQLVLGPTGARVRRVGFDLPCPMPTAYRNPATLGVDRWLGAFAAAAEYRPVVAVDCGSATTVNVVDAGGVFVGGCIGPGLRAIEEGMRLVTPKLPSPTLDVAIEFPAIDSSMAIETGVALAYAGMVEKFVSTAARGLAGPLHVVVTGGNADRLLRWSRLRAEHRPTLVHMGMRLMIEQFRCAD